MSTASSFLAFSALIPLCLNPALYSPDNRLSLALCSAGTGGRAMAVPIDRPPMPGEAPDDCCPKGCHAGSFRKRNPGDIDPGQ